MRLPVLFVIVILAISLGVDIFIYRRLRHGRAPRGICIGYVVIAAVALSTLLALAVMPKNTGSETHLRTIMWILYAYLSIYVPKIVYSLFALLRMGLSKLFHRSLRWVSVTGAVAGVGIFALMWWGALFNRYNIDVNEVEVEIPALPAAFDGYRIVQLSDIHTGSFSGDTTFLDRVVEKVNSLRPDVIVFTGDIVNRHSAELRPY
ncbi:MAG: metallophosphoesterase, partial [Muribaculaceae bacterium]|nr:metallophosphoesterase [Muribaculaceae bacterium]